MQASLATVMARRLSKHIHYVYEVTTYYYIPFRPINCSFMARVSSVRKLSESPGVHSARSQTYEFDIIIKVSRNIQSSMHGWVRRALKSSNHPTILYVPDLRVSARMTSFLALQWRLVDVLRIVVYS